MYAVISRGASSLVPELPGRAHNGRRICASAKTVDSDPDIAKDAVRWVLADASYRTAGQPVDELPRQVLDVPCREPEDAAKDPRLVSAVPMVEVFRE
jgi:hypothetical protein